MRRRKTPRYATDIGGYGNVELRDTHGILLSGQYKDPQTQKDLRVHRTWRNYPRARTQAHPANSDENNAHFAITISIASWVSTICLGARVACHGTCHRLGAITIRSKVRIPTYAISPKASHARRFPKNIDSATFQNWRRDGMTERQRPVAQSNGFASGKWKSMRGMRPMYRFWDAIGPPTTQPSPLPYVESGSFCSSFR